MDIGCLQVQIVRLGDVDGQISQLRLQVRVTMMTIAVLMTVNNLSILFYELMWLMVVIAALVVEIGIRM